VIRELTGGIYFGDRKEDTGDGKAFDMMVYTVPEVERITRCAAKIAMGWVEIACWLSHVHAFLMHLYSQFVFCTLSVSPMRAFCSLSSPCHWCRLFCIFFVANRRKKKLTSVDKANVLACSRLWRKTVTRVIKEEFPEIELDHQYVDACAMHMIRRCVPTTLTSRLSCAVAIPPLAVNHAHLTLCPCPCTNSRVCPRFSFQCCHKLVHLQM
jgi:hypothetical protein